MNKNTVEGSIKETGGKIRHAVDNALGDKKGAAQGKKDQIEGNAQKNYGKVEEAVEEATE